MILIYLVSNHQFNPYGEYRMCFQTLSTNWYSIHVIHNTFPVYPSVIVYKYTYLYALRRHQYTIGTLYNITYGV